MTLEERKESIWNVYRDTDPGTPEAVALLDVYLYLCMCEDDYKPRHLTEEGQKEYRACY